MDIVKEVNGQKHIFCLPASQYVAGLIKKQIYHAYDLEVELVGTGASIKKITKRKIVDHYDKENVSYIRAQQPPIFIGGFYWESEKDLAVFYKTNTEDENKLLKAEGILRIPYDVFKNLREQDLIEIKGILPGMSLWATPNAPAPAPNKAGKEYRIQFRATKGYIKQFGKNFPVDDDMPLYEMPKEKFAWKILEENTPSKTAKEKAKKKWIPKKGGG